ncbi:MAG: SIMPL domain-containing protein, partial [Actinomycetota bacterium]|nr:SIMPL domain-containing protein [Actinomycetota bacterium]
MRRSTLAAGIAVLALAAAACTPQVTVEAEPAQTVAEGGTATGTGIAVTGTGEVSGTPDTLTMSFGVSVLRDTVAQAVADAAVRSDAIISALEANGVA